MRKREKRLMKILVSSIVTMAVILSGSFMMNTDVNASTDEIITDNGIVYQKFENWSEYWGKSVPQYEALGDNSYGYVFGGWFLSQDQVTYVPVESTEMVGENNVYAKFVPAYVLSVKCQNQAGTDYTNDGSGSTNLKVISSVDSTSYESYGFELSIVTLDENGNISGEPYLFSTGEGVAEANVVYEKFKIYDEDKDEDGEPDLIQTVYPSDVFGEASKYFSTWRVNNIPESSYGTIILVKPYWKTMDGMTIYGLSKYAHVEDGLLHEINGTMYRYVNVPINVRDTKAIAAGMLNVDYSVSDKLELFDVEGGIVFEEMRWNDKGTSVRLVGNVSDISYDKKTNDILANLRFLVASDSVLDFSKEFTFKVTDETFCGIDEMLYDSTMYDVWNIKY